MKALRDEAVRNSPCNIRLAQTSRGGDISRSMTPDATQTERIVEADGLAKVFRDFWHRPKVNAVRGITFAVNRGEVFGLLGPNGSGKSTTIKMILGLLFPTKGSVRVLGKSPREVKTKARIGYLPEESYLYPYLTSEETLNFYGKLFDLSGSERKQRIDQLFDMIGLQHARNRKVGEFSKGMARRIGLAQALINDPDLVILDEPTSGLDPLGCRQVKDLILTLAKRGKTVIMSSHLLADVEDVCDRVAIMYNGRFQALGGINELLEEKARHRVTFPGELSSEQVRFALGKLREFFGREPEVDHPRRDLEQFFLDVVEKARQEAKEASGADRSKGVASYLQRPAVQADVALQRLVVGDQVDQAEADAVAPAPGRPDEAPIAVVNRDLEKLVAAAERKPDTAAGVKDEQAVDTSKVDDELSKLVGGDKKD